VGFQAAPGLLRLYGVGPDTAATLLIAVRRPSRPAPVRSRVGASVRFGADPGHLGQDAEPAPAQPRRRPAGQPRLWRIVITRMGSHPPTRAYVARRSKEGLSKPEIIRCLKRYASRLVYPHLRG